MTTQAPWKWHKRKHSGTYFLANENETDDFHMIIDDGSAYGEYGPSIDVNGEDAKLIAAAPELLEALQQCIPHLREQSKNDGHAFGTLQLVNRIIAKALGETK